MPEDVKKIIQTIKNGELPPLKSQAPLTSGSNIHAPERKIDFIKRASEASRLGEAAADEKIKIALEKQTPRTVKRIVHALCPACGVHINPFSSYCYKCGQAFRLEWDILKG